MLSTLTLLVAIFFAGMGVLALVAPERITATVGAPVLTLAGRNEARAVYGGFGIAMCVILIAAPSLPAMTRGIYITVAMALGGMAAGRLVAAAVERPRSFFPCWLYCAMETAMAVVLFAASNAFPA
jgi:hypothetical protein